MFTETGKVVYLGAVRSGISSRTGNEWKMQDVVIETQERYIRRIIGTIRNKEHVETANLSLGEIITLHLEPDAHEYGGNWFTDMTILDITQNGYSRFVKGIIPTTPTQL